MPLEQFAIMESVPVGAIVVSVAFLNGLAPATLYMLSLKFGNAPLFARHLLRSRLEPIKDEFHDLFGYLYGIFGIVTDAQHEKHIGESHDAQAYLAVGLRRILYPLKRIGVHIYDIIEEMDGLLYRLAQLLPVDLSVIYHLGTDLSIRGCSFHTAGAAAHRKGSSTLSRPSSA